MQEDDLAPASHEVSDVGGRFIAIGFVSTTLGVVSLAIMALAIYPGSLVDRTLNAPLPPYPEPRLQINPGEDWADFHRRELARLNSDGWIDQSKGLAHIPIDVAMRKIAQQGISDWPSAAQPLKENANEAAPYAGGVAASQSLSPGPCATNAKHDGDCLREETRRAPSVRKRLPRWRRTWRSYW
jgi:hypothetical protein